MVMKDLDNIGYVAKHIFIEIIPNTILSMSNIKLADILKLLNSLETTNEYNLMYEVALMKSTETYKLLHKHVHIRVGYRLHLKYIGLLRNREERLQKLLGIFQSKFKDAEISIYLADNIFEY